MWNYQVIQSSILIEEEQYTTYGIACEDTVVHDISPNKKSITDLVHKLNLLQLLPIHLNDVIDDFIIDPTY